jgi:hypothetical protein
MAINPGTLLYGRTVGGLGLSLVLACLPLPSVDRPAPLDKIAFDLSMFNESGLYGPADGKRSLDYAFCLPSAEATTETVRAIDPSVRFFPYSPGRIGCGEGQVLAIGNTHQVNHQSILMELAQLETIDRIQAVDWE